MNRRSACVAPCDLRWAMLSYCLNRLDDGSYLALNRHYKPLGYLPAECGNWVAYENVPARFRFARLTPATIRALSARGSDDPECIYFYNDGCIPIIGTLADTRAYFERLARFVRLKAYPVSQGGSA